MLKKISKWTIVGYIGGLVFTLTALYRYLNLLPDYDRAISYGMIGILIMCVSWLYNNQLNKQHKIDAIEEYLAEKNDTNKLE